MWPGWHAEVLCRVPVRTPGEKNRCKAIIELCKETKGISSHWLQRDDDLLYVKQYTYLEVTVGRMLMSNLSLYYKPLKLERPDGGLTLFDICSMYGLSLSHYVSLRT